MDCAAKEATHEPGGAQSDNLVGMDQTALRPQLPTTAGLAGVVKAHTCGHGMAAGVEEALAVVHGLSPLSDAWERPQALGRAACHL